MHVAGGGKTYRGACGVHANGAIEGTATVPTARRRETGHRNAVTTPQSGQPQQDRIGDEMSTGIAADRGDTTEG
jgi:hypothetical protein